MVGTIARMKQRVNLRLAIPVAVGVCLVLTALAVVGQIPKTFAAVIGLLFLLHSAVFWWIEPATLGPVSLVSGYRQIGALLLSWLLWMSVVFGSLYWIDRAGWLWFQVTGFNTVLAEDLTEGIELPVTEFVRQHPSFIIDPDGGGGLILRRGLYEWDETVVVPRGTRLKIEPGAELRFGAGRSLISYSPIRARGTVGEPIRFTAKNQWLKWGVVGVVGAEPSLFENVIFEHGRQALVNGVNFYGALSLIETDVEIRNSHFTDLHGRDGVNVQYGHVVVQDNVFRDLQWDGLDLDGGSGLVSGNLFVDCGDEGLDLGENGGVVVVDNKVLDPRGGRISADHNLEEILSQNTRGFSEAMGPEEGRLKEGAR